MYEYLAFAVVAAAVLYQVYTTLNGKKLVQLSPIEFKKFKLIEKIDVIAPEVGCHTMLFRFGLPLNHALALPCGQHISIKGFNESKAMVVRQYTPTTNEHTLGHFDVIIKIYPTGQMGNYLKNLPIGSFVELKGPNGNIRYKGNGLFTIRRVNETTRTAAHVNYSVKNVGMIAGGSGITPMLQIIQSVSQDLNDSTKLSLIFGNRTVGDIMCRGEIEAIAERNKNFNYHFMVDSTDDPTWTGGVGFITKDTLKQRLPAPGADTMILLCGPPPMIKATIANLNAIGYTDDMITTY
jgi:cytochrome-b5 reductase